MDIFSNTSSLSDRTLSGRTKFFFNSVKNIKIIWLCALTFILLLAIILLLTIDPPSWKFSVCGGLIGFLSSLIVIFSYRHSASMYGTSFDLLVIRSFCDLGLALRFMFEPMISERVCGYRTCYFNDFDDFTEAKNYNECSFPTAVMEFFEISSEAWFLCLAFELSVSLSDPFSTFQTRLRKYVFGAFGIGLFFALIVGSDPMIYGFWRIAQITDESMFCWIRADNTNFLPWFLFYIPICIVYFFSLYTIFKSYLKLKEGISSTFKHRIKALVVNSANICVCAIYWSSLMLMYLIMEFYLKDASATSSQLYKLMLFTLAAKGSVDLYVWIIIVDGQLLLGHEHISKEGRSHDLTPALREEVLHCTTAGVRLSTEKSMKATEYHSKIVHYLEQIQSPNPEIAEVMTLRRFLQILFNYGEEGSDDHKSSGGSHLPSEVNGAPDMITKSPLSSNDVENKTFIPRSSNFGGHLLPAHGDNCPTALAASKHYFIEAKDDKFLKSDIELFLIRAQLIYQAFCSRESRTEEFRKKCSLYLPSFNLTREKRFYQLTFEEYEPYWFRRIRQTYIEGGDRFYVEEFLSTVKARLVEGGASGAFFFFSRNERFIAKSCTATEVANLRKHAEEYSNHMVSNKDSYISRIYGAYQLTIYGTPLSFFVMNNIFVNKNNETINEKYDIKGSSVNRSAKLPRNGQGCICARCNQKFTYYKKNKRKRASTVVESRDTTSTNKTLTSGDTSSILTNTRIDLCPYSVSGEHKAQAVMKDNDLREKIRLPPILARQVYRQLEVDAKFLRSLGVMDYSLLIGVHTTEYDMEEQHNPSFLNRNSKVSAKLDDRRLQVSKIVGPASYYMGIIDFLQKYNVSKRLERYTKVYFMGKSASGLSAIEPVTYHKRFMQKIREILLESESDPSGDSNVMVGNDDDAGSDDDDTTPLV